MAARRTAAHAVLRHLVNLDGPQLTVADVVGADDAAFVVVQGIAPASDLGLEGQEVAVHFSPPNVKTSAVSPLAMVVRWTVRTFRSLNIA